MGIGLIVSISVLVLLVLILISTYNAIIRRRNEVDNAFGGMDVQLKKRYDLIPNLVSTVKQYAEHEQTTLTKLTELRAKASKPETPADERVNIDNEISANIRNLMLNVENYPNLKANENFLHLQASLNEVEAQISASRRAFNAAVTDYNNGIQVFPNSIIAGMMGMKQKAVFIIPEVERENVSVDKLF
ncbi:MAG: LemA family protein [Bacteroidales bacterium]